MHRHAVEYSTYPRGPRSGPGCSVPVRHHLFGPIRPTRRHIAISPHGGLYAMPSLCGSAEATREWIRAFACHSVLTCRPLRPRGVRRRSVPANDVDIGLPSVDRLGTPENPANPFRAGVAFRGFSGSHIATDCQVACPPCTDLTGSLRPSGTFT